MSAQTISPSQAPWLEQVRLKAWREFCETPPPAKTSEFWRRMDFGVWRLGALKQGQALAPLGRVLADPGLEKSIEFSSLEEAAKRPAPWIEPHLKTAAGPDVRALEAANKSLWRGGAFLRVPAGVRVETPVEISFVHKEGEGPYFFPRALVVAEAGSEVTVVESHTYEGRSQGDSPWSSSLAFSHILAAEGAKVRYFYVQELSSQTAHFWHQRVDLAQEASLRHYSIMLGGAQHKSQLAVHLNGRGARSEIRGILLGRGKQVFDPRTDQVHCAAHTYSDLLFRTALRENSRSIYTGLIRIEKEAVGSEAYQSNHNLLLSDRARADTTPILEILTDAVRCKHGATAGPLDEEDLFYLASRGLREEEATRMLVSGFFEPILGFLPTQAMAQRLRGTVEAAL